MSTPSGPMGKFNIHSTEKMTSEEISKDTITKDLQTGQAFATSESFKKKHKEMSKHMDRTTQKEIRKLRGEKEGKAEEEETTEHTEEENKAKLGLFIKGIKYDVFGQTYIDEEAVKEIAKDYPNVDLEKLSSEILKETEKDILPEEKLRILGERYGISFIGEDAKGRKYIKLKTVEEFKEFFSTEHKVSENAEPEDFPKYYIKKHPSRTVELYKSAANINIDQIVEDCMHKFSQTMIDSINLSGLALTDEEESEINSVFNQLKELSNNLREKSDDADEEKIDEAKAKYREECDKVLSRLDDYVEKNEKIGEVKDALLKEARAVENSYIYYKSEEDAEKDFSDEDRVKINEVITNLIKTSREFVRKRKALPEDIKDEDRTKKINEFREAFRNACDGQINSLLDTEENTMKFNQLASVLKQNAYLESVNKKGESKYSHFVVKLREILDETRRAYDPERFATDMAQYDKEKSESLTAEEKEQVVSLNAEFSELMGREDYDGALSKANSALKIDPLNETAISNKSAARLAIERNLTNDQKKEIKELVEKAGKFYEEGKYAFAISTARKILRRNVSNVEASRIKERAAADYKTHLLANSENLCRKIAEAAIRYGMKVQIVTKMMAKDRKHLTRMKEISKGG